MSWRPSSSSRYMLWTSLISCFGYIKYVLNSFCMISWPRISNKKLVTLLVGYGIERMNNDVSRWMRGLHDEDTSSLSFIATRGYDSVVWNRLYSRDSSDYADHQIKQASLFLIQTFTFNTQYPIDCLENEHISDHTMIQMFFSKFFGAFLTLVWRYTISFKKHYKLSMRRLWWSVIHLRPQGWIGMCSIQSRLQKFEGLCKFFFFALF